MGHGSDENICTCGEDCNPYRFCKKCDAKRSNSVKKELVISLIQILNITKTSHWQAKKLFLLLMEN
jgi:hypothetical protein